MHCLATLCLLPQFLTQEYLILMFVFFLQIIYAKGAHFAMPDLTHSEYDVIGLDWTMNIHDARVTAPGQTLMGNLDPCALYANEVRETWNFACPFLVWV